MPALQIAITRASVTSWAVIPALIDQPTTRLENRSMTAATKSQPSAVQTYVKSAIHLRLGSGGFKAAAENVGCDGARLPLPQIGRQAAPAWTCLERLQPHQSLNPM